MSDLRTVVEREMDRAGLPSYSFIDLGRRRERRRRTQRLATILVAVAISSAAGVLIGRTLLSPTDRTGDDSTTPTPSVTERPTVRVPLTIFEGMWPQVTIEEARDAQRRADEGDPGVTWQLPMDPVNGAEDDAVGAEIATRYVEQELGWEHYRSVAGSGTRGRWEIVFIRCEPGETNPLYTVGRGRTCAPTIDAFRYETVRVRVVQPVRTGRGGIWVVDLAERLPRSDEQVHDADWHNRQYEQVMPPTEDEIRTFVHGFLEARVAGGGAEEYLDTTASVPLLYSTIEGASYDRAEIASLEWGPLWPDGSSRVIVNLFAGDTQVVQPFIVWPGDVGLRLEYTVGDTTQDGLPAPDRFGILGGRVTFDVARPWFSPWMGGVTEGDEAILLLDEQTLVVLGDVAVPEGDGCTTGRLASVNELVQALENDADLEVADVVRTELGGVEAVRLDVRPAPGAERCAGAQFEGTPVVIAHQRDGTDIHPFGVRQGHRLRLYLLDLPGEPARVLAVLLTGPEETFDALLDAAAPILRSIRFG